MLGHSPCPSLEHFHISLLGCSKGWVRETLWALRNPWALPAGQKEQTPWLKCTQSWEEQEPAECRPWRTKWNCRSGCDSLTSVKASESTRCTRWLGLIFIFIMLCNFSMDGDFLCANPLVTEGMSQWAAPLFPPCTNNCYPTSWHSGCILIYSPILW